MKEIKITSEELDKYNALLQKDEIDFEEEGVEEDATLLSKTVRFDDGVWADLRVCSGQTNCWAEVVWFDKEGYEIACSDADAIELEGEWLCSLDPKYNVLVTRA